MDLKQRAGQRPFAIENKSHMTIRNIHESGLFMIHYEANITHIRFQHFKSPKSPFDLTSVHQDPCICLTSVIPLTFHEPQGQLTLLAL